MKICVGSNKLDVSFGEKEINPQGFTWELNSGPSDYQSDALTTETLDLQQRSGSKSAYNSQRPQLIPAVFLTQLNTLP